MPGFESKTANKQAVPASAQQNSIQQETRLHTRASEQMNMAGTNAALSNSEPSGIGITPTAHKCHCGGVCSKCQQQAQVFPKLNIGAVNNHSEQEADRVALRVMTMTQRPLNHLDHGAGLPGTGVASLVNTYNPVIQRACRQCSAHKDDDEKMFVQTKPAVAQSIHAPTGVSANVAGLERSGTPLSTDSRAFFEPRFGYDFSRVKVHTNRQAADLVWSLNARAFTFGNNLVFGAGEYRPSTSTGKQLIAHELTHVVQQSKGSRPGIMRKACGHDGQSTNCGGHYWRLIDQATQQVTGYSVDELIVSRGLRHHFGGTWASQVQTPPNPIKTGKDRGAADAVNVSVGPTLRVEMLEVKPRSTDIRGGCTLATREAREYARSIQGIASEIVQISNNPIAQASRINNNKFNLGEKRGLLAAGIDLDQQNYLYAWNFYKSLQRRLGTRFTTGFSAVQSDVNKDGTPNQDYNAGPPVLEQCSRGRKRGVRTSQLMFQVNGEGGLSYGCEKTPCQTKEEKRERKPVRKPRQKDQPVETPVSPRVPVPVDQNPEMPGELPGVKPNEVPGEVPQEVPEQEPGFEPEWIIPPAIVAGGALAIRQYTKRLAAEKAKRLLAQKALEEAERRAKQAAWRKMAEAAAKKRAEKQLAKGAGKKLVGKAASKALVYGEIAAAAVVGIMVLSGKAEASVGPGGSSPLEALYQIMTQNGTPPSEEMKALIESDPVLKQLAQDAASSGDGKALSAEAMKRMMEIMRNNPDEFSPEDLQLLMEVNSATAAGNTEAPKNEAELRAAIENARAIQRGEKLPGQAGGPAGTGSGAGAGEGDGQGAGGKEGTGDKSAESGDAGGGKQAGEQGGTEPGDKNIPNISQQVQEKFNSSPANVKTLFNAMVAATGGGPEVNDEAIEKFLATVPADLTEDETKELIKRLRPTSNQSLDEIMAHLKTAIQTIRTADEPGETVEADDTPVPDDTTKKAEDEQSGGAAEPAGGNQEKKEEGVTLDEYTRAALDAMGNFEAWDSVTVGNTHIRVAKNSSGYNKAKLNTEEIGLIIYGKAGSAQGAMKVVAFTRAVVIGRNENSVDLKFVADAVFIGENKKRVGTVPKGYIARNSPYVR